MRHFLFLLLSLFLFQGISEVYGQRKLNDKPVDTSWYVKGDVNYNLLVAAYLGIDKDVSRFIREGAYVNTTTMNGNTPLILAAGEGHIPTTEILLTRDANINEKNKEGISPLLQAVLNNHPDMVSFLINHGANIQTRDKYGRTPLIAAAALNHTSIGDILLKSSADPDAKDKQGTTPLMVAVYGENTEFVKLLLKAGADINQKDKNGFTALLIGVQKHNPALVDLLVSHGADIFILTNTKYSPLLLAVQEKDLVLAEKFISLDTIGFFQKELPINPIELADENKDPEMKDLLIENDYQYTFSPYLHDLRFGMDMLFNVKNFLPGIRLGITEGITKISFYTGFNYRMFPVQILEQSSSHIFHQYWEYRGLAFAGLGREFPFMISYRHKPEFGAHIFVSGFVSFGPSYPGSNKSPSTIFSASPSGGLYLKTGPVRIAADYCWYNFHTYDFPDSYFSLKIEYILSHRKLAKTQKFIPWYK